MSLVFWARQPEHFPLRAVEIQHELKWTPKESISEVVSKYMSGGFFGLNVEAVQQGLATLPWTASVSVKRVWPDRISVSITEQTPLARFGDHGIISTEGRVFYPDLESLFKLPKGLPVFNGPERYAKEMLHYYFELLEMLGPLGLTISELSFSPECSLKIRLDNGIAIIIGKSAIAARMARFVMVYPNQLQKEVKRIGYLDLRYTNGLAIGWKTNSEMNAQQMNSQPKAAEVHADKVKITEDRISADKSPADVDKVMIDQVPADTVTDENGVSAD